MSETPNSEIAILNAALELSPDARAAYLDQVCAGDVGLRKRLEELIQAHAQAEDFLQTPSIRNVRQTVQLNLAPSEKPGDTIGRYKLLQQIGEGGCGVVYMAEQEEPVRRRVALKVIKLGMDTKQVIARFEAERQALALMDHPNIAKVLDAGVTETGRPYFVMELVRGVKITEFCDENNVSTPDRLKLFIQVCQAIQHAHQKGIIHRDIKPSNILVTINDGVPLPKVIDFGIAKATAGRLTDHTLFTAFEQFIGTPAYMSPEQAVMTSLDIDTRSDVYSLGVLLYELLIGKTPFDPRELLKAGFDEMRRIIREQEPPRPSTRLSTMVGEELTTTAKHRCTEPPKLAHVLRGDLDWIVMKCLEKERARRYETANGLAADIQRYINDEPVVARPPSKLYEFQKTVRRHKFGFAAATALFLALTLGGVVSTWQAIRATKAEHKALGSQKEAESARAEEANQRLAADTARDKATQAAEEARRNLYAADMNLCQQALLENNLGQAAALLEKHAFSSSSANTNSGFWEWRYLWNQARSDQVSELGPHTQPTTQVAFSPDGRIVLSGCDDRVVRAWEFPSGRLTSSYTNTDAIRSVAYAPSGAWAALSGFGGLIVIWDPVNDRTLRVLTNQSTVAALAISPDERWLAAGSFRSITLWNLATGEKVREIPIIHRLWLRPALVFAPDSSFLLHHLSDGTCAKTDLISWQTQRLPSPHAADVLAAAFSPDTKLLVTGGDDGVVKVRDAITGQVLQQWTNSFSFVSTITFSPDGRLLATAGADQRIRLYDVSTWRERSVLRGHRREIWSLAFSPNSEYLVSAGSTDNTVLTWRSSTSPRPPLLNAFAPDVTMAAVATDGSRLLLVHTNRTWSLQDCNTAWKTQPQPISGPTNLHRIACGPKGGLVTISDADGTVWLIEPDRNSSAGTIKTSGPLRFLRLSGDGRFVALTRSDYGVEVWSLQPLKKVFVLESLPGGGARSLALSRTGNKLAIGMGNGRLEIYEVSSATLLAKFHEHGWLVVDVAISPDENTVVTSGAEGNIKLYDLKINKVRATLSGQLTSFGPLAFSPSGDRLAAGGADGTVILWDLRPPEPLQLLRLQDSRYGVGDLTFSEDGDRLVAISPAPNSSGGWLNWQAATGLEIAASHHRERKVSRP